MCGIAGYSVSPESSVNRTLAAQALLAGIAERGADAVGYAWEDGGPLEVHKQRSGASALLEGLSIPASARTALLHVRDYTKGHPTIEANNHPIRHGAVVGVHNGVIANDEELFERYGFARQEPEMTVDSEAIFALVDDVGPRSQVLERLHGSMATAWVDERFAGMVFLARGVGRPLWIGEGKSETFFASTRATPGRLPRTRSTTAFSEA
jgi:glucosamine 6-phosphate synthetase-like amidotransferase/phosphosugar isomerase protein